MPAWNVFLAQGAEDKAGRGAVVRDALRTAGLRVWASETGVRATGAALVHAVRGADVVLVLVTRELSDEVQEGGRGEGARCELELANESKGPLGMLAAVLEPEMAKRQAWSPRLASQVGQAVACADLTARTTDGLRKAAEALAAKVRAKMADPMAGFDTEVYPGLLARPGVRPFEDDVCAALERAAAFAPGTRQWLLDAVHGWASARNGDGKRMLVLLGGPGTGKSTLAAEVARRGAALGGARLPLLAPPKRASILHRMSRTVSNRIAMAAVRGAAGTLNVPGTVQVGAYHAFVRGDKDHNALLHVFVRVANQLCRLVPALARDLSEVQLRIGLERLRLETPLDQFRTLIAGPCSAVRPAPRPVLVVLDALDECDADDAETLMRILQREGFAEAPKWLRFLVTAQPESFDKLRQADFRGTVISVDQERDLEDAHRFWQRRLGGLVDDIDLPEAASVLTARAASVWLYARLLGPKLSGENALKLSELENDTASFPFGLAPLLRRRFGDLRDALGGIDVYSALLQPVAHSRVPVPTELLHQSVARVLRAKAGSERPRAVVGQAMTAGKDLLVEEAWGAPRVRFVHDVARTWLSCDDGDVDSDELRLPASEGHGLIADLCLEDRGSAFAARHALFHLCKAGRQGEAVALVLDSAWLAHALESGVDPAALVADMELTGTPADDVLRVLEMAGPALRRDPLQLAAQLCGRLVIGHRALRRGLAVHRPWLRPIKASLTSAESALRKEMVGHIGDASSAAMEGDTVVSGSYDETVRVWDAPTGRTVHTLRGHDGRVLCVAIRGDLIASGAQDNDVRLWRTCDGRALGALKGHTGFVEGVAMDDVHVVSGSQDLTVRVWGLPDGCPLATLAGHTREVQCVAIAGDTVVSGSRDRTVRVWSIGEARQLQVLEGHSRRVFGVAIDGDRIASCGLDRTVRVWKRSDWSVLHVLDGHAAGVLCVAMQGGMVASGAEDGAVRTWDAATGELHRELAGGHRGPVNGIALQGGLLVSACGDMAVRAWSTSDARGAKARALSGKGITSLAAQGEVIVSGGADGAVRLWSAGDGRLLRALEGHTGSLRSVAIDGDVVVSGGSDRTVCVWRASTGELLFALEGHNQTITSVAIEGNTVVSSSLGAVLLWDAREGRLERELERCSGSVWDVAIEGNSIIGTSGSGALEWSRRSGRLRARPQQPRGPRSAAWPCGAELLLGGAVPFTCDAGIIKAAIAGDVIACATSDALHVLRLVAGGRQR